MPVCAVLRESGLHCIVTVEAEAIVPRRTKKTALFSSNCFNDSSLSVLSFLPSALLFPSVFPLGSRLRFASLLDGVDGTLVRIL